MPKNRVSWDELFMEIAFILTKRSSCLDSQAGAVMVTQDNDVISTGYNGSPAKLPNCSDLGVCSRAEAGEREGDNLSLCKGIHAEANAMLLAAKNGHSTKGAKLYCTHQPCKECAKQIVNAGIAEVVYSEALPELDESIKIMHHGDVRVKHRPFPRTSP